MSEIINERKIPCGLMFGNHLIALATIRDNPMILIRELSLLLDLTERSTQRIVNELEEVGLIHISRNGRRNVYSVFLDREIALPGGRSIPVETVLHTLSQ